MCHLYLRYISALHGALWWPGGADLSLMIPLYERHLMTLIDGPGHRIPALGQIAAMSALPCARLPLVPARRHAQDWIAADARERYLG